MLVVFSWTKELDAQHSHLVRLQSVRYLFELHRQTFVETRAASPRNTVVIST
jgi:hypothetical protein